MPETKAYLVITLLLCFSSSAKKIRLPLQRKISNGFIFCSPSVKSVSWTVHWHLSSPEPPPRHPHRLLTCVSVGLSITETERQWDLIVVGYLAVVHWPKCPICSPSVAFQLMLQWKCCTAEHLSSGSFWHVLVARLVLILWRFLKPKNHPLKNWNLVLGSSLVRICLVRSRNHYPFTFNLFFRSSSYSKYTIILSPSILSSAVLCTPSTTLLPSLGQGRRRRWGYSPSTSQDMGA